MLTATITRTPDYSYTVRLSNGVLYTGLQTANCVRVVLSIWKVDTATWAR